MPFPIAAFAARAGMALAPVFMRAFPLVARRLFGSGDEEIKKNLALAAMPYRDVVAKMQEKWLREIDAAKSSAEADYNDATSALIEQLEEPDLHEIFWNSIAEACNSTLTILSGDTAIETLDEKVSKRSQISDEESRVAYFHRLALTILAEDAFLYKEYLNITQTLHKKHGDVLVQFAKPRYSDTMSLSEQEYELELLESAISELREIALKKLSNVENSVR